MNILPAELRRILATLRRACCALPAAGLVLLLAAASFAHETRPVFLQITEIEPHVYSVQWKVPSSVPPFNLPQPVLPAGCLQRGREISIERADAYIRKRIYECPGDLAGQQVALQYPVLNPALACLVRVDLLSGQSHTGLVRPGESAWQVPSRESPWRVARDYTWLGVRHIFAGLDHLLFVACLVLVSGSVRRTIVTITGFTLAHSITLILSTLDVVSVPNAPVEAVIALSILFLASEIAKGRQDSWTFQYPIAVSTSFGLLHGLGFASVLKNVGLPQTEIPISLLFFNFGIELGQVAFVLGLLLVANTLRVLVAPLAVRSPARLLAACTRPGAYLVGSVAACWLADRVWAFWQ